MIHIWSLIIGMDGNLHASRIPDPAMQKAHPIDHRPDERELSLKTAVHHLKPRIPMGEVAVELQFRELSCELHGTIHILKERGAMCFDVERNLMPYLRQPATQQPFITFAAELLAPGIYYARSFGGSEESNRWEQSFLLAKIARECFAEAEHAPKLDAS